MSQRLTNIIQDIAQGLHNGWDRIWLGRIP